MQKKATIIGARGFIGGHLLSLLLSRKWDCLSPDNDRLFKTSDNLGHVFYCAGLTADYLKRPFDTIEAHVSLLSRILQHCTFDSLVYLSSTRLYDSLPGSSHASEDSQLLLNPNNPRNIYDLSKAAGESLCVVTGKGRARIARLSCVYKDHTDADGFLPQLLRQIITYRPKRLEIDSSASFARDYIHLEDVLEALLLIAEDGRHPIYNVASGENIRNDALFEAINLVSGCQIVPCRNEVAPPPPQVSIQRMQDEFSWKPSPVLKKITSILEEHNPC